MLLICNLGDLYMRDILSAYCDWIWRNQR